MRFAGKIALVSGAGSGIGRAVARAYAGEGARVFAADINAAAVADLAAKVPGLDPLTLDVGSDDSIADTIAAVRAGARRLDILFNAAGIYSAERFHQLTRAAMSRVLEVNLVGASMLMRACAALMAESGGGAIVNVASVTGRTGGVAVAYSASKAGLISTTQSAARALAGQGVRVNAIAPGPMRTSMWTEIQNSLGAGQDVGAFDGMAEARIPMGRLGTPDDLVAAALFLSSSDSAYITGQTINVDGGMALN